MNHGFAYHIHAIYTTCHSICVLTVLVFKQPLPTSSTIYFLYHIISPPNYFMSHHKESAYSTITSSEKGAGLQISGRLLAYLPCFRPGKISSSTPHPAKQKQNQPQENKTKIPNSIVIPLFYY